MTDRRAKTSRANLGHHVPEALGPDGSVVVTVRLPARLVAEIDAEAKREDMTRSEYIRDCLINRT